ncbi:hypothetical protein NCC78_21865, partial [Micromonospora phytophila]|uniref:phosphoribosyltransferase family protein n=1 Tax=Micromonospora phytophila TaxID=709888 RepID=UPI00202F54A4
GLVAFARTEGPSPCHAATPATSAIINLLRDPPTPRTPYLPGSQAFSALISGRRVAIVDDVINAGSAVRSTAAAVRASGAEPVVIAALLRLGETALRQQSLAPVPLTTLASWPNTLWEPQECPLCTAGVPLEQSILSCG